MSQNFHEERQTVLKELASNNNLHSVLLNPGPSLTYFTGLHFHLSERPVVFALPVEGLPTLILPELEAGKAQELPFKAQVHTYGENPLTWGEVFKDALSNFPKSEFLAGMEYRQMRLLEYNLLTGALPKIQIEPAEEIIAQLRMSKSTGEIEHMREAVRIAEN
ncbi:MAG: aminopeptidase P family protein, partial [Phycisphaerae bacterium]|nr:aminopeptidase P family protein [Phycisphaerae bacterium]